MRRQLGQAERDLATATADRERLLAELAATSDHRRLAEIGDQLGVAHTKVAAAEELWLSLADEAEAVGLDL